MRKPLLGLLVALAAALAGFLWGRSRKAEALRREAAARAALPAEPVPAEPPDELPSDASPADSVPRGLE